MASFSFTFCWWVADKGIGAVWSGAPHQFFLLLDRTIQRKLRILFVFLRLKGLLQVKITDLNFAGMIGALDWHLGLFDL